MTRPPVLRASFDPSELILDSFAGGGGASTGIEWAIGRSPDVAINHDPEAIEMHRRNHPGTHHYTQDIYTVDPVEVCRGRRVGALWASPACTHFSRALGTSTELNAKIRDLGWVICDWAEKVKPRVIFCENVTEWQTWGPLLDNGRPDKNRTGETWRAWLARLVELGYEVEFRELVAADYGAPTTRRRLYVIARCDGLPIVWPAPTHRKSDWIPAHTIIDWSLPCRSIFGRKKGLALATMQRIALGVQRFVVDAPTPFVIRHGHYSNRTGAGIEPGKGAGLFRGQSLDIPLATVCATNDKHLVLPVIAKHYGGPNGHQTPGSSIKAPLSSVTAIDHHSLTLASTVGDNADEVAAFLTRWNRTGKGSPLQAPLPTITCKPRFGLVRVDGRDEQIRDILMRMLAMRELYRAQGFPDTYQIDGFTQKTQNRLVGNSVCPQVARALVAANLLGEMAVAA
jgi:DNA (cytosine-5)-methyltransferase 1